MTNRSCPSRLSFAITEFLSNVDVSIVLSRAMNGKRAKESRSTSTDFALSRRLAQKFTTAGLVEASAGIPKRRMSNNEISADERLLRFMRPRPAKNTVRNTAWI